jgi:hypothetical protein
VIRTCGSPGCNTLTLGSRCFACEQKEAKTAQSFARGRPYIPARPPAAEPAMREGENCSAQLSWAFGQ